MIRFRKDTPRYWFMSNYYSCEFVMNGIRYRMPKQRFRATRFRWKSANNFQTCLRQRLSILAVMWLSLPTGTKPGTM